MNDDNKITKKDLKYKEKQEEVLKKVFTILELDINDKNVIFNTSEFNKDINKQDAIKKLELEVTAYYPHSKWKYFKSNDNKSALSLLKSIITHHKYKLYPLTIEKKEKGYLILK